MSYYKLPKVRDSSDVVTVVQVVPTLAEYSNVHFGLFVKLASVILRIYVEWSNVIRVDPL